MLITSISIHFQTQARDSEDKLVGSFSSGGAFILFFFDLGQLRMFYDKAIVWCPENLCISVGGSKYLKCDGMDRATVTHTSRDDKETITFK